MSVESCASLGAGARKVASHHGSVTDPLVPPSLPPRYTPALGTSSSSMTKSAVQSLAAMVLSCAPATSALQKFVLPRLLLRSLLAVCAQLLVTHCAVAKDCACLSTNPNFDLHCSVWHCCSS